MKLKRGLSLIFAALLIMSSLLSVSCGGEDKGALDTTAAADNAEAETTAELSEIEKRQLIPDNLPESDFGGYVFTIMTYSPGTYYQEEETGDLVNDVIFRRNRQIEERFNFEIRVNAHPGIAELDEAFKKYVTAGEKAVDI